VTVATVLTRAQLGLDAPLVRVEVYCGPGLPQVNIVGLAETTVRESRDRVQAALVNSGFAFPDGRVTINLSPADLPKEGGRYDLAIALGMLAATGQLDPGGLEDTEFYGELSLSGALRPVPGLLVAAVQAARAGHRLIVPAVDVHQARLAPGVRVAGSPDLLRLVACLAGKAPLPMAGEATLPATGWHGPDLSDVRGQESARRALEVAAAGGHGMLMIGPPGSGKSMLAERLPGLLPPLDDQEAIESAMIHSIARDPPAVERWRNRPFRSPHHSASGRRRRRYTADAGRDLPCAPRRAVPRRVAGIQPGRPRGAARTARDRLHQHRPGHLPRDVSGTLPAAGRDEPLSLWPRWRA